MNNILLLSLIGTIAVLIIIQLNQVNASMSNTTLTPLQAYFAKITCIQDDSVKAEDMEKCYDDIEKSIINFTNKH